MDRLTDYNNILNEVNFEVPSDREGAYNILDIARYSSDEEEKENILLSIADRLLAYEDTDLEPEQIDELNKMLLNDQIRHGRALDKLLEYQKLEKQGLLIKLPCKIGQDLYIVSNRVDGKGHVRRLTLTHNNLGNVLKRLDDDIFKTREEAEKALEESNGE